jgi:CRISPR-associated protein Csb2
VVWSRTTFSAPEVEALLGVERLDWGGGRYPLRVVPLPWNTPAPAFLRADISARVWANWGAGGTPFVPPYFSLARSGRPMRGGSPGKQVQHLVRAAGLDVPVRCEVQDLDRPEGGAPWVHVHPARHSGGPGQQGASPGGRNRFQGDTGRASSRRRAFWKIRLEFERGVPGPLLLGHSAHFGLGQFTPVEE